MRLWPLIICIIAIVSWIGSAGAATVTVAKNRYQKPLRGVTVEGEFKPGDTAKLIKKLREYALNHKLKVARTVYLRSKGGDVAEAAKMGVIIRQLRLETNAPTLSDGHSKHFCGVAVSDSGDCMCASACFLAYAGGIRRTGDHLILHRPFMPKAETRRLSDIEYRVLQKDVVRRLTSYLESMEMNRFFIKKMMSSDRRHSYHVTHADIEKYPIGGLVPSVQKIVLAKCPSLGSEQGRMTDPPNFTTKEEREPSDRQAVKRPAKDTCIDRVLDKMRLTALQKAVGKMGEQP